MTATTGTADGAVREATVGNEAERGDVSADGIGTETATGMPSETVKHGIVTVTLIGTVSGIDHGTGPRITAAVIVDDLEAVGGTNGRLGTVVAEAEASVPTIRVLGHPLGEPEEATTPLLKKLREVLPVRRLPNPNRLLLISPRKRQELRTGTGTGTGTGTVREARIETVRGIGINPGIGNATEKGIGKGVGTGTENATVGIEIGIVIVIGNERGVGGNAARVGAGAEEAGSAAANENPPRSTPGATAAAHPLEWFGRNDTSLTLRFGLVREGSARSLTL